MEHGPADNVGTENKICGCGFIREGCEVEIHHSAIGRATSFAVSVIAGVVLCATISSGSAIAQEQLPAKFANDPVAKALGPKIFNAALKEGKVTWYGATSTGEFLDHGGLERFEKRFGIKIDRVDGRLRGLTDRLRTEAAVGRLSADVYLANDQYLIELYKLGILEQWRPPSPEIDKFNRAAFVQDPVGYWWPVQLSAQALVVNTNMVKPDEIKSYWDLVDPKWKGKIAMRDPRSAGGGAWHMMNITVEPSLGVDYIKKLVAVAKPFIISGGTNASRDVVVRGQFAVSFSGRGEFLQDLPKGAPLAFVVPKEGMAWTPASIALVKGGPDPNAAKVLMTWFFELPQLQLWGQVARGVPHPDVKPAIPEMSVTDYPLMKRIPDEELGNPDPFFKQMEEIFGIR
jgi:iron(III) transport system substrate-binding protein